MGTDTAVVIQVTGQAWVREADGTLTPVYEGMKVPANVNIVTAEGASVQIKIEGLPPIIIGGQRDAQVSDEVSQDSPDPTMNAVTSLESEVSRVFEALEALNAGEDLLDELDPTAAVLTAGNDDAGGSSFTRLMSIVETNSPITGEDSTVTISGLYDTQPGFGHEGTDTLDIRGLLSSGQDGSLDDYFTVVAGGENNAEGVINVSTQGKDAGVDQQILLQGIAFTDENVKAITESLKASGTVSSDGLTS